MTIQDKFGLFRISSSNPLYIVNDKIWQARPRRIGGEMRLAGLLSAWLKGLAQQTNCTSVLTQAREHINKINELQFCLGRLMPYLRFLETGNEDSLLLSSDLEQMLFDLSHRAAHLKGRFGQQSLQSISTDRLQEIFCTPCVVKLPLVIPLEPVGVASSGLSSINVRYIHNEKRAKRFDRVIVEIEEEFRKQANRGETKNSDDNDIATAFMQEIENIINRLQPLDIGSCKVIYFDRHHQLLYNCGHFVLVRGPLTHVRASQRFHLALNIAGKTRQEMLAIRPRICRSPQELWAPNGTPTKGGMCMGNSRQYQRLFTEKLTDEEAIVEWLDAGVIIYSGISALHRQLREGKLKLLHRRHLNLKGVIRK